MPLRRAAVLLLSLVVLAGCGDGDVDAKNAYVDAANRSVSRFEDTFARLEADFSAASTPARDRRTLARFAEAVGTAERELTAIRPPAEVTDLHRRLVAQVAGYRQVIERARRGLAAKDVEDVARARTRFSTDLAAVTEQITRTIESINRTLQG